MAGNHARLNREKLKIERDIDNKHLFKQYVCLLYNKDTGQLAPEFKEQLMDEIDDCNRLINSCNSSIGEIRNMTLPSGQLVAARKNWMNKQAKLENIKQKLDESRNERLDILCNYLSL